MGKNVQILLTDEQFQELDEKATKVGQTVSQYIKGAVLEEDEFNTAYEKLIEKVNALPSGREFTIRSLFGTEWTMSRGVKLSLGKAYNNRVKDKTVKNVVENGKDSSNVMWYTKL